ncbi:MAG: hypothetical protein JWN70_5320 [Planctomycetaceae bacterium]|nr:hypothetical protein [Planctomycetaceae bacterium]
MHFTCFTTIKDCVYLKQVSALDPPSAVRQAIGSLPFHDGTGPFDDELEWLQQVCGGEAVVTMHPVGHCKNTWLWLEGSRYEPQYLTYAVQTDMK